MSHMGMDTNNIFYLYFNRRLRGTTAALTLISRATRSRSANTERERNRRGARSAPKEETPHQSRGGGRTLRCGANREFGDVSYGTVQNTVSETTTVQDSHPGVTNHRLFFLANPLMSVKIHNYLFLLLLFIVRININVSFSSISVDGGVSGGGSVHH